MTKIRNDAIAAELAVDAKPSHDAQEKPRDDRGRYIPHALAAKRRPDKPAPKKPLRRRNWAPPDEGEEEITRAAHQAVLRALRNDAARARSWGAAVMAEVARGRAAGFAIPPIDGIDDRNPPATREEAQARVVEWLRVLERDGLIPRVFAERVFVKELGRLGYARADIDRLRLIDEAAAKKGEKDK